MLTFSRPLTAGASRRYSTLLLVLATAASLVASPASETPQASAAARKPNIVVIMTDDQTMDSLRYMPILRRRLAAKGTSFSNSFVSYPLCCPSRVTFLTGQYSHNNGVIGNNGEHGGWGAYRPLASTSFPAALQQAGYHTAHFGKVLNQYGSDDPGEVPPGWSTWNAMLDRPARNRYYGFPVNLNGRIRTVPVTGRNHNTDYFARRTRKFIRSRAGLEQPFFANLWLFAPHGEPKPGTGSGPTIPAARHVGAFADEPFLNSPSINERDVSDKPRHLQRSKLSPEELAYQRRIYRWRLETLLGVDEAVGDIVKTLRETRQLKNTMIVFTSDNGYFHGEHRIRSGKWHVYDESTRVPLVVRGPGIPAGQRLKTNVANIDLGPTLLDYAGADPLIEPDGRTLRPLISGRLARFKRDLLLTTGYGKAERWYTAIRTPRFLYVEHVQDEDGEDIFGEELYDLANDPHQLRSLHADPSYADRRLALRNELYRLRNCAGASCHSRAQLPPPDDGGKRVAQSEIIDGGPVDDPEQYPAFFADAQPAPSPEPSLRPRVRLRAVEDTVAGDGTGTFIATVTADGAPLRGVRVWLEFRMRKTRPWIDVTSGPTGSRGKVKLTTPMFASASWRARVRADDTYATATSTYVDVTAEPVVKTRLSDRRVPAGRRVVIAGTVTPFRRNQSVALQTRKNGAWVTVAERRLDEASRYAFKVRAAKARVPYRVRKAATSTLRSGTGPVRVLTGYRARPTVLVADPAGADGQHLNNEFVVVRNTGAAALNLDGWTLRAVASRRTFALPRHRLAGGERVRIHSGVGRNRAGHLYLRLRRPLWRNGGDAAVLRDRDGVFMGRVESRR